MTRSRMAPRLLSALLLIGVGALVTWARLDATRGPASWDIEVIAAYPHDPGAFTQGLAIHDGQLYEGTGQYGRSSIRRVDLETGRIEKSLPLGSRYFGEGITILGERLYQLTWQAGTGFVYDVESFSLIDSFRYRGEGWGLTHDGSHLIASDGTATLRFIDPATYDVVRELTVTDGGEPVERLNELEFVDGEIWANIWYADRIARIETDNGRIVGWVDLSGLYPPPQRPDREHVLNGIAFDAATERLFVTGKNWPRLYQIEIVPR